MKDQQQNTLFKDFTTGFTLTKLVGIIITLIGLVPAFWLIYIVEKLFNDPDSLKLLNRLAEADFTLTLSVSEQIIRLHAPDLLTYGVPLLLILVVIRIASAFIRLGGDLLRSR